MNKINALTAAALMAVVASVPAFAQSYTDGGAQTVTPEQMEECKSYGIPEFACTEYTLLAKRRMIAMQNQDQELLGDSGKPMLGTSFGEMGTFVVVLGAIFGGVAAAFFVRAKVGQKVPI